MLKPRCKESWFAPYGVRWRHSPCFLMSAISVNVVHTNLAFKIMSLISANLQSKILLPAKLTY